MLDRLVLALVWVGVVGLMDRRLFQQLSWLVEAAGSGRRKIVVIEKRDPSMGRGSVRSWWTW